MKKIHKSLISILIVLVFIFVLGSCSLPDAPEEYTNYVYYDYHLMALKTKGRTTFAQLHKENQSTCGARFKKIAGESEEQFLSVTLSHPGLPGSVYRGVVQNPDNYVDPWQDWTIEKIEIGYIERTFDEEKNVKHYVAMKEVLSSTSDVDCIAELKNFVLDGEESNSDRGKYEMQTDKVYNVKEEFCIRVYFEESQNIVWVSELQDVYSPELNDRIIYLDRGKEAEPPHDRWANMKFADVSEYENLYNWISQSIAGTNSNNDSF